MNVQRFAKLFLVTCLLMLAYSLPAHAQSGAQTAMVTVWRLNVREAPSLSAQIITVIGRGQTYPVLGGTGDGSWYQIQVNPATTGYVFGRYVQINNAPVPTPTPPLAPNPAVSTANCTGTFFFSANIGPACPTLAATSLGAAYQRYDNGFMVWMGNGDIIIFYATGSFFRIIPVAEYGAYPDIPSLNAPPGHVQPVNGFGRVWWHDPNVQQRLGWPVEFETGYTTTLQYGQTLAPIGRPVGFLTLPDGSIIGFHRVMYITGGSWFRVF